MLVHLLIRAPEIENPKKRHFYRRYRLCKFPALPFWWYFENNLGMTPFSIRFGNLVLVTVFLAMPNSPSSSSQ